MFKRLFGKKKKTAETSTSTASTGAAAGASSSPPSYRAKEPKEWTTKDVKLWLKSHGMDEYSHLFEKNSIDGEALLLLTNEDIQRIGIVKIGHQKKMSKLLDHLQERSYSHNDRTDDEDLSESSTSSRRNSGGSSLTTSGATTSSRNEFAPAALNVSNYFSNGAAEIQELASVLEHLVDSVCLISTDKIIKYVNKSLETAFGYSRDDILGCNVKILMADPHYSNHDSYVDNYLRTGVPKILGKQRTGAMLQGRSKDGSVFPISLAVHEHYLKSGERIFMGTVRDLRLIQPKRTTKVNVITNILDNMVNACIVVGKDCSVQFINKSAEALFGFSRSEAIGMNVNMFMPEQEAKVHDSYVNRYLTTKTPRVIGKGRSTHAKKKDGTVFDIWLSLAETKWGENDDIAFIGTIHELLQAKVEEEREGTLGQLLKRTKTLTVSIPAPATPSSSSPTPSSPVGGTLSSSPSVGKLANGLPTRRLEVEEIMDIPAGREALRQFMKACKNVETLDFIEEVDQFTILKSDRFRFKAAERIRNVYLRVSAQKEVNLPSEVRSSILERFVKNVYDTNSVTEFNCPSNLFQKAYLSSLESILSDVSSRFYTSAEYKKFMETKPQL